MIAEAENFLDKSTSCNASDMWYTAGTPTEVTVNLLTKASGFFTLIITYFDFFCRIHRGLKIPSNDISKDTVFVACTHS